MKAIAWILMGTLSGCQIANRCCAQESHDAVERPSVLFIAIDDLNDWIGCLGGHPQALTPNLDRLANRGILFTNAHCAAPACNPSRAAVFSGRMPDSTGVWSNESGSIERLAPDAPLIPQTFAKAGYETAGTGKLLHQRGGGSFDEYFQTEQRWSPFDKKLVRYTPEELPTKGTSRPRHQFTDADGRRFTLPLNGMPSDRRPNAPDGESFDWGPVDVPDDSYGDTKITDWALKQINRSSDQSLFLGVGYYRPHQPLWAPKRFFDRFQNAPAQLPETREDDLEDLGESGRRWALEAVTSGLHTTVVQYRQWRPAVEAYLACISYIDHEVGRLLDSLDACSRSDNTLIVLWSDHGWHLGEKQHWGKWTGWERSTRVPLIIVPPRKRIHEFAAPGSRCDQPVGLIDIYPTLLDFCGIPHPTDLEGKSLLPLMRDPIADHGSSVVTMFGPGNLSVRTKRWRYIRYEDRSEELYDLKADPNEWTNLIEQPKHQRRLSLMRRLAGPSTVKTP